MEEKIPFSFRNQIYPPPPNTSNSYKTTTVSTMNGEDFVVSLNKEMDLILQNIDSKSSTFPDNFHGSPNFNQNINNQLNVNKTISDQKKNIKIMDDNQVFLENDSFGQEKDFHPQEKKYPVEMKDLSKNFKDSIDREKFAEVLNKNYELKHRTKDLETKLGTLISELSECQKALENTLKIQITSSISEEMQHLAENHNSLKKDLECLEDENEKLSQDLSLQEKKEKDLNVEIDRKTLEIEKFRKDYTEELNKVNKLLEMNQELNKELNKIQKENNEKLEEKDKIIQDYKAFIERKEKALDESKGNNEKNNRNFEKNVREMTETNYRNERNLKRTEIELKEKTQDIENLRNELQAIFSQNREVRERNEEYLMKIEKMESYTNHSMQEFDELTQDLKEIIKELTNNLGSEEYFSKEFKSLPGFESSNPYEMVKEMIITAFKEIQNLINKLMSFSGFFEKCSEDFESKREAIEDKWLQKVQVLNEERDYLYELFSKTCQRIKNERFSEIVSKLLGAKNEALTQDMEVKLRETEYFSLENNLKRQLAEKNLKPENIIQIRSDLEKKKAQLIFLKKNHLKAKEEISYLEEEFENLKNESIGFNLQENKISQNSQNPHSRKISFTQQNERPERLSLKDKLDKSRKLINSPSKI